MPNLAKALPLFVALFILTGCPTPPKAPERVTPLASQEPEEASPPPALPQIESAPAEIEPPPEVPPKVQRDVPRNAWLCWSSWCERNGLNRPQAIRTASGPKYDLKRDADSISLIVGSRILSWNGLNIGLGFAPRMTNGLPFIHSLDLSKSLLPLIDCCTPLPRRGNRTVVIDPGHGGENGGAVSVLGKGVEKDYTLDWALRLRPLLASQGWNVYLTRDKDIFLSNSNRVAFADLVKADLFVSLHFNSIPASAAKANHGGIETYCLTPAGMPSSIVREFEDNVALSYPNNAYDSENLQYAVRIHRALVQFTNRRDRGVRRARFMTVLQGHNRPAVLIEGGYLSDPDEARLVASANYRQKMAEAVAFALSD